MRGIRPYFSTVGSTWAGQVLGMNDRYLQAISMAFKTIRWFAFGKADV